MAGRMMMGRGGDWERGCRWGGEGIGGCNWGWKLGFGLGRGIGEGHGDGYGVLIVSVSVCGLCAFLCDGREMVGRKMGRGWGWG